MVFFFVWLVVVVFLVFLFNIIHVHLLANMVGEEESGRNSKVRVWEFLRALQS